jgi:hypothetical protein
MTRPFARIFTVLAALIAVACTSGMTSVGPTYFQPSRITVQDLIVEPAVGTAGQPVHIRFRLVRAGDDGAPIYWTSHLLERPAVGGALARLSGGPLRSGASIDLVYAPTEPTLAYVSIYPASTADAVIGDGSGDWVSLPISVR